MPLPTPRNGFVRRVTLMRSGSSYFQLHVMDSANAQTLLPLIRYPIFRLHVMDSFTYTLRLKGMRFCFQLHVMDSEWLGWVAVEGGRYTFQLHVMDSPVGETRGCRGSYFQLHVMDSITMYPHTSLPSTDDLSTPCNGFKEHYCAGA